MKNKIIKKVLLVFFIIFFFFEIAVTSSAFISKKTEGYSNYFGYSVVLVQSDSMTNSDINRGSRYLIHKESNYTIGDIVVFEHNSEFWFHQIVAIYEDTYVTKGSSNPNVDPFTISKEDIKGRYTGHCVNNLIPLVPILLMLIFYIIYMSFCAISLFRLLNKRHNSCINEALQEKQSSKYNSLFIIFLFVLITGSFIYPVKSASSADLYIESSIYYNVVQNQYLTYNDDAAGDTITGYDNNSGETTIVIPEERNGTAITKIDSGVFNNNNSVKVIDMPATITSIGWLNFMLCDNLEAIIVRAETPPQWTSWLGWQLGSDVKIYVPEASVKQYKKAAGWSKYKNQIYSLDSYEEGIS